MEILLEVLKDIGVTEIVVILLAGYIYLNRIERRLLAKMDRIGERVSELETELQKTDIMLQAVIGGLTGGNGKT